MCHACARSPSTGGVRAIAVHDLPWWPVVSGDTLRVFPLAAFDMQRGWKRWWKLTLLTLFKAICTVMNSLIYVDAYYMSNLKKKKKKRRKKDFFPHCKCPCHCLWSAWCTTSQFVTDFAWTKNLVENLRLTTKKGLFSTNIPRNYPLSMIPNLLGFVRKMGKNKKKNI